MDDRFKVLSRCPKCWANDCYYAAQTLVLVPLPDGTCRAFGVCPRCHYHEPI